MSDSLLDDLPCRGTLANAVSGACFGRPPPVYVCDHDTAPPEDQVLKQDYTNVVIRALQRKDSSRKESTKKGKEAAGAKKGKGAVKEGTPSAKRQCLEAGPSSAAAKGGATSGIKSACDSAPQETFSAKELQGKALKDLMVILRRYGVEAKAKKGDVIKQILECQERKK